MLPIERKELILGLLRKKKLVKIRELEDILDVSLMTIHRDIKALEKEGKIKKLRGAIVGLNIEKDRESLFEERAKLNINKKVAIAKEAVKLIKKNEYVLLDAGTTTFQIAKTLDKPVTVVTNDLYIGLELSNKEEVEGILTGGVIRKITRSLIGPETVESIRKTRATQAFIAASGVSENLELLSGNPIEGDVKRAYIKSAQERILVVDSSKFGHHNKYVFAHIDEIDTVITDWEINKECAEKIRESGKQLIIAKKPDTDK